MPTVQHTPEPFSSTTISLNTQEQQDTGIQAVFVFPATISTRSGEIIPAGFQICYPSGAQGIQHPYQATEDLPPQLQSLTRQVLQEYISKGPVPAPAPLSPRAERARSGSKLGQRLGKGHWSC